MKKFETYSFKKEINRREENNYYFETEKHEYKCSFNEYQGKEDYYALGFRARLKGEVYYSTSIIANENPFELMKTILEIINTFIQDKKEMLDELNKKFKSNISLDHILKGFIFSFVGDKEKNKQRLNLYKRYLKPGMELELINNIYYIHL